MKTSKKIIIGNWKMNPESVSLAKDIFSKEKKYAKKFKKIDIVVCPPFPFIAGLKCEGNIFLGAQDVFFEEKGSFTGFVSAHMLKSVGASYVIIGHSERRKQGESDELIAKKIYSALKAGIIPIVCIGESVRDAHGGYFSVLKEQIEKTFSKINKFDLEKLIVAYEPVWAIGRPSSEAMKPRDIHESAIFIKKVLSDMFGIGEGKGIRIVYGGSVDSTNAREIVFDGGVDGLLVGRESLDPAGFAKIFNVISNGKN